MPVFLNNQTGTTKPVAPKQLLTKYYSLLTGNPNQSRGWFGNSTPLFFDKYTNIIRTIEGTITKTGESPQLSLNDPFITGYDLRDLYHAIKELNPQLLDYFKIDQTLDNPNDKAYLFGFSEMEISNKGLHSKQLYPNIFIENLNNYAEITSLDTFEYRHLDATDEVAKIDMAILYQTAMKYYFNTNMQQLLVDIANSVQTTDNERQALLIYDNLKKLQGKASFNAAQLGAFVQTLLKKSPNKNILNQKLLQFPELTFASLSEQFEIQANAFDDLV